MAAIIYLPDKVAQVSFRRKENFAAQFCCFSIQLAAGCSHTPIDENRPFSAVFADMRGVVLILSPQTIRWLGDLHQI